MQSVVRSDLVITMPALASGAEAHAHQPLTRDAMLALASGLRL